MAGTVAKIYPYNSVSGPKSDGFRMNPAGKISRNMEEDDILNQLSDSKFNRRAEIIEQLRGAARKNGGKLPFQDQKAIFRGFTMALADQDWDVRNQCLLLISELIPHFDETLDSCMAIVLPRLVPNMGDSKITIRRAVIQTLHVYMKYTYDIQQIFRAIVQHGLENPQQHIKKEAIIALPMLFTPEFSGENFFEISQSLAKKLLDTSGDNSIKHHTLLSMDKIRNLVGEPVFNNYLQRLSPPLRKYYFKVTGKEPAFSMSTPPNAHRDTIHNFAPSDSVAFTAIDNYTGPENGHATKIHIPSSNEKYEYGVIPSHIMDKLHDQGNFRVRAQAVEELKLVLRDLDERSVHIMAPHVSNFISCLRTLLDDSNFKITTVTLEIIGLLVFKQGQFIRPHVKSLVSALTKPMSDTKIVIRQAIMKVVMQLMQILTPKEVLSVICENLSNRNSRVRQESLNIVIASLLTFPSYDFDLSELCQTVAHTLVDPKRQVRQAALESFAVIASNLGAGKMRPLVAVVDAVELSCDGDGVMAAVQARLARRLLPKLNLEGLVEYATPVPTSAGARGGSINLPPGADIEWILCASGGIGSSARSNRSDLELESVVSSAASSARSTPAPPNGDAPSHGPTPRRYMSAGRGKNRLPWDDSENPEPVGNGTPGQNSKMTTRQKQLSNSTPTSRDQSPDAGNSYRQLYLKNREKRVPQQTEVTSQPFSVYNPNRDDESHSNYSTPRSGEDPRITYGNPWPDDTPKPNKRLLEPIADNENEGSADSYTIPTKPALARGSATHNSSKRKVPPIALGERRTDRRDDLDSARDSVMDGIYDDDSPTDEMYNSIRQIRHSATRKKVDKIFEKLDTNFTKQKRVSRSPSPIETIAADSGFSSKMSTLRSEADEIDGSKPLPPKKKGKKTENPFESKPRLARKPSMHKSEQPKNSFDYSPHGGVTFKENPNLNLQMVGTGYGEDSHPVEYKPSQYSTKPRDRRRVSKGTTALSAANSQASVEPEEEDTPAIVGRGMFDGGNASGTRADGSQNSSESRDRRVSRTDNESHTSLGGVYGVRVRQNSLDAAENDDDDDPIAISQATRATMQLKVKQRKEEAERVREEKERIRQQQQAQRQQERDRLRQQQEKDRLRIQKEAEERQMNEERNQPSPTEEPYAGLSVSGNSSANGKTPKSTSGQKRKPKPPAEDRSPPKVERSSHEPEAQEELKPLNEPHRALDPAMKQIAANSEEWYTKCSGINSIRRLVKYHPEMLTVGNNTLHSVVLAILEENKNLRSQVSRLAIICLGEMLCSSLKKAMEPDLDVIARVLLHKAGESNGFIREDVDRSLQALVENGNPQRAMLALIAGGANHKNVAVRSTTARFLVPLVFKMGPGRVLSGVKDADKILPIAANFLLDSSPETRYYGMQIMDLMMSHEDFERCMKKALNETAWRNIQDKLDTLRKKGLPDPPTGNSSARNRRSGLGTRTGSSRFNSALNGGTDGQPGSSKHRSGGIRTDEATMDDIKAFCAQMAAKDWKERQTGIMEMQNMATRHPEVVGANITKIFDKFVPCLKDANSKVNLLALRVMCEIAPSIADSMSNVISLTIQTITENLSSKNPEIYQSAAAALDTLMEHLDHAAILQPFCQQAMSTNTRIKPDMLERVAYLLDQLPTNRHKTISLQVYPLLWHLLEKAAPGKTPAEAGTVRYGTIRLIQALHGNLGNRLLTDARNNTSCNPRMLQIVQDMLEIPIH